MAASIGTICVRQKQNTFISVTAGNMSLNHISLSMDIAIVKVEGAAMHEGI
jgi:hypothetical protein